MIHFIVFAVLVCAPFNLLAQWKNMSRFNSYGLVNYHSRVDVKNAKRIIEEVLSMNPVFKDRKLEYNKNANICVNECLVDPLNTDYVYIIHAIKDNQGKSVNLFFYYIENRRRYFYEIDEGNKRISLVWDPAFLEEKKER